MLDLKIHSDNLISLKNTEGKILLADKSLDGIFDSMLSEVIVVYFEGFRLDYDNKDLGLLINNVSANEHFNQRSGWHILIEVYDRHFTVSRNSISQLWTTYEYPALLFLKERTNETGLIEKCRNKSYIEDVTSIPGLYILYQSFEPDVLWIAKSSDMSFDSIIKNY